MSGPRAEQLHQAEVEVFADYNSFELTDEDADTEAFESDRWIGDLIRDQITAAPGAVGIGTARRMTVSVTLDVFTGPPNLPVEDADQVTEASLTTGGRIAVGKLGFPSSAQVLVPPGTYRVRVLTRGLDTLSDDLLDGDDSYQIVLWPGEPREPTVVTRYAGVFPSG